MTKILKRTESMNASNPWVISGPLRWSRAGIPVLRKSSQQATIRIDIGKSEFRLAKFQRIFEVLMQTSPRAAIHNATRLEFPLTGPPIFTTKQ